VIFLPCHCSACRGGRRTIVARHITTTPRIFVQVGEGNLNLTDGLSPISYGAPLKIQISSQLLRCGKNFLLTYQTYAARQNFFRALLTTPHGLFLPVADRRPLVGHLGEL
jgi:hypothetical protein